MSDYHEPENELQPFDRDIARALNSLKEEVEAVNWYHQRVVTCADPDLKQVLSHNRDEEIEHACMALEWLRRNVKKWDQNLRTYLFSEKPITEIEEESSDETSEIRKDPTRSQGDIGIGSLKDNKS